MSIEDTFHSIEVGEHTYFTLQIKRTHANEKFGQPLLEIPNSCWGSLSWDNFGNTAEPWAGSGNDYKPVFRVAYNETHDVWSKTGRHGWWTLIYAVLAMKRMKEASDEGRLDYIDIYNRSDRKEIRYAIRVVKVTVSKKMELVNQDDFVEALLETV